jgi:hypothetical protein
LYSVDWHILLVVSVVGGEFSAHSCNSCHLSCLEVTRGLGENGRNFWCNIISKKYFRPGGMAPSEWMRSVRAVRDTPMADYSAPGLNTTLLVVVLSSDNDT